MQDDVNLVNNFNNFDHIKFDGSLIWKCTIVFLDDSSLHTYFFTVRSINRRINCNTCFIFTFDVTTPTSASGTKANHLLHKHANESIKILLKMERILDEIGWDPSPKPPPQSTAMALKALAEALQAVLPLLSEAASSGATIGTTEKSPVASGVSATWLFETLHSLPSELGTEYLVRQVWEASRLPDEARQQTALFDVLGASEEAMQVMFSEIAPNLSRIALISECDLSGSLSSAGGAGTAPSSSSETFVDLEEERRRFLLREAQDAAQMAAIAQAEADAAQSNSSATGTHTVTRASDKQAIKWAAKAQKRAAVALRRAVDAGAIINEQDLLQIDSSGPGTGGFMGQTSQEMIYALQSSLLPEGSKQYYDKRGLPRDTIVVSFLCSYAVQQNEVNKFDSQIFRIENRNRRMNTKRLLSLQQLEILPSSRNVST